MALKNAGKAKRQKVAASQNAFAGQVAQPSANAVESALGSSYALWNQLVSALKHDLTLDGEDWHTSGPKYGWFLRLQRKKRNIVYLGPRVGFFMAAFVLGDMAVASTQESSLPIRIRKMIAETKKYGEGTPVRIEVRSPGDLDVVRALAKIKVEN